MIKQLNSDQKKALKELLHTRDNLHITGFAGTGKSYLIKLFREIKKMMQESIPMVASTGAASLLVNGVTFNSYFGLGILSGGVEATIDHAMYNHALCERLIYTDTIVIDEISMISATTLKAANLLCQRVRMNDEFFGGIRVIFVGDFFQLGPFSDNNNVEWAFDGDDWKNAHIKKIELKKIMRTKDKKFLDILAKIRVGKVDKKVETFLNGHILKGKVSNFEGTIIFSRNNDVDNYNKTQLESLDTPTLFCKTAYAGEDSAIDKIKDNLIIPEVLELKRGALIMVRINNFMDGYVNGTLGHVLGISGDVLNIKTLKGDIVRVKKHNFDLLNGNGEVIARAKNYPVTLAWAITIHKSQGASIDKALIALDRLWLHGQAYTALSRLSSAEGLFITKWDKKSFIVDPKVIKYSKKK
jgi:hypothetical protein